LSSLQIVFISNLLACFTRSHTAKLRHRLVERAAPGNRRAVLDKGLVHAGVASAPRPGFHELVDLATQRIPFLQGAIIVRRSYLQNQRPIMLNFLKAFVESMKTAREKPDTVVASLVKHLRVRPEVAREAYRSFASVWEEVPYVRPESVQAILDFQSKESVKDITPEKYIDNSLIKDLETSGFIKSLYRK
jgi:ABC-type nitrate/sulfonate/bicarbonate transport system substrate-binding protein